mmetsp:Transcript_41654/g.109984  ORF Transcript_41654/g.109984 Transcript_41654/m.109984 type:complete len:397 (+) Transcript_41654:181-1371(+)
MRAHRVAALLLLALDCRQLAGSTVSAMDVQMVDDKQYGEAPDRGANGAAQLGQGKDLQTELLHWAIEHSDPERIKELMVKYRDSNLTIKDVYGQDVFDAMFANEASIMTELIGNISSFRNASVTDEELQDALESLRDLVDQVDNAGNLHRMGGLAPLLDLALGAERAAGTRAEALWTLGVAVQNNQPVQKDLVSLDGLRRLAESLLQCSDGSGAGAPSDTAQYCGKLLYVISGLIKNDAALQAAADGFGVLVWLLDVGMVHGNLAVAKKALSLLETVLAQSPETPVLERLPARRVPVARVLLEHIGGRASDGDADSFDFDIDAAEKALALAGRVLSLRPVLFASGFRSELAAASAAAVRRCRRTDSTSDEVCEELAELARQADTMLAASEVADDEL